MENRFITIVNYSLFKIKNNFYDIFFITILDLIVNSLNDFLIVVLLKDSKLEILSLKNNKKYITNLYNKDLTSPM